MNRRIPAPEGSTMPEHANGRQRAVLPMPDRNHVGVTTYDAKSPGHELPADRAAPAARGRAERADRADRRRRLRLVERLRRSVRHAELRAPGGERAQVQPLPHDGALLADAAGSAHGSQSSLGRHGRDHGDRDLRAGLQLDPAQDSGAAGGDAEAERLLDSAVRQMPRGAGLGDQPDGAVRRAGRPAAAASSISTASSAARRTSTPPRSTRAPCRSSPTARRRRATTSPRT